jgi:hypothetical protein
VPAPPPQPPTVSDWTAPGAPPPVPPQPGGAHDYQARPAFTAGTAPLPAPSSPALSSMPVEPVSSWGPPGPGMHQVPPAGRPSRAPLIIVSVVAGLLLVVGGVMTYLWVSTASELDDTRVDLTGQVEELNTTVGARDGEIDRLNDELQQTQDELSDAQTALEGTENQVDVLEEEKDTIRQCLVLFGEANAAIEAGDDAAAEAILAEAEPICEEADRALGF